MLISGDPPFGHTLDNDELPNNVQGFLTYEEITSYENKQNRDRRQPTYKEISNYENMPTKYIEQTTYENKDREEPINEDMRSKDIEVPSKSRRVPTLQITK